MRIAHAVIDADDLIGASFPAEQPAFRHGDGRLQVLLGDEQTWLRATPEELQAAGQRFITLAANARDAELARHAERAARADETIARAFGPEPRVGGQPS